jgi:preprotein translocase subunit SecY
MSLATRAVIPLKVFLAVMFAILLLLQVMSLPGQFAYMAEQSPELAYLRWPLTALSVFWVLCVQVVVVSTWRLLTLVKDDRIFSDASFAWVDAIIGAIAAAWVVLGFASLYVAVNADDPGFPILVFLVDVCVTVLLLLMLVMRALLRQATALRTDMEAVI